MIATTSVLLLMSCSRIQNVPGKRIQELAVLLTHQDAPDERKQAAQPCRLIRLPGGIDAQHLVSVSFIRNEADHISADHDIVRLQVTAGDRNWALLLADALEPEVMRTHRAMRTPRWLLWLVLIPLGYLAIRVVVGQEALSDLNPKSVFIAMLSGLALAAVFVSSLVHLFFSRPAWILRLFGPESSFLWGDEAHSYPQREQTRKQIQWTVIVGFIVSAAASIFVAMPKK